MPLLFLRRDNQLHTSRGNLLPRGAGGLFT
nr:MAG TPA: hypothetical protein [Caudoviricetes sp.]